uniref:PBZ-type domain-containing protein n=1 Tax=Ciona intestinalis TaxID=7719 RepID=F6U857_CIOIN
TNCSIQRQDVDESGELRINEGNTTLGRGGFLKVDDKKVSRTHAVLELKENKLVISSTHANPCFVFLKASGKKLLLKKGGSVRLTTGDEFSLLQNKYKYKVSLQDDSNNSSNKDVASASEETKLCQINEGENSLHVKPKIFNKSQKLFPKTNNQPPNTEETPKVSKKRKLPSWMNNNNKVLKTDEQNSSGDLKTEQNLSQCNENVSDDDIFSEQEPTSHYNAKESVKHEKENELDDVESNSSDANDDESDLTPDRISEPDDTECRPVNQKSPIRQNSLINQILPIHRNSHVNQTSLANQNLPANQNSSVSQIPPVNQTSPANQNSLVNQTPSTSRREPCVFGRSCYRKNPNHFSELSHPGDSDYESPPGSDEDEDKPECEYGLDCYRRNPLHRKQFKHTKRKVPKRQTALKPHNGDSDDEYDDSFVDDSEEEIIDEDSDWDPSVDKKKKQKVESESDEELEDDIIMDSD